MKRKRSLTSDILSILIDRKAPYRILHRMLEGYYEGNDGVMPSHEVLRATLSRLKKNNLVTLKRGNWTASDDGATRAKTDPRPWRKAARPPKSEKNMIIIFDVPEIEKLKRDWLSVELKALGFVMLQKSVWFGPAPVPKEFIEALHKLKILPCMRFFTAKEAEIA